MSDDCGGGGDSGGGGGDTSCGGGDTSCGGGNDSHTGGGGNDSHCSGGGNDSHSGGRGRDSHGGGDNSPHFSSGHTDIPTHIDSSSTHHYNSYSPSHIFPHEHANNYGTHTSRRKAYSRNGNNGRISTEQTTCRMCLNILAAGFFAVALGVTVIVLIVRGHAK